MTWDLCKLPLLFSLGLLGGPAPNVFAVEKPSPTPAVQFERDIRPILEASCAQCHGRGKSKGDFRIDNREALLRGGESGAAVVPGNSSKSLLLRMVSGLEPDRLMPQKGDPLTPEQIERLRGWIDQGLVWDSGTTLGRPAPFNLRPRRPSIPDHPSAGTAHPVDHFLTAYFERFEIQPGLTVADAVFARRVFLDVIGLLPSPEELRTFLADVHPEKRARLVRRLLSDRQRYAEHWLTFWNDRLRNDHPSQRLIQGQRQSIGPWLYEALASNQPFDQFTRELLRSAGPASGFLEGIAWTGEVSASQSKPMQAAQNVAQVFLGVNLKCAACHDSFVDDYSLEDAYSLASIFAEEPLELFHCDQPTGRRAPPRFLYPALGQIEPQADRASRLDQLAILLTSPENGRLARTIVNRLWARLLGRGLVEPVDEMDSPAWHPDLLDWLAEDLVAHGYDLARALELILTSQAYQLPAVNLEDDRRGEYVFRGPAVRRLTAEQFRDALSALNGEGFELPADNFDFRAGKPADWRVVRHRPKLIGENAGAARDGRTKIYFRQTINLSERPVKALAIVAAEGIAEWFVNGRPAAVTRGLERLRIVDIHTHLRAGQNVVAIRATPAREGSGGRVSASLAFYARIVLPPPDLGAAGEELEVISDRSWMVSGKELAGWNESLKLGRGWRAATELADLVDASAELENMFFSAVSRAKEHQQVRAALVATDPLMTALGRPQRLHVQTSRPSLATAMQALELTNGETLAELLEASARHWLKRPWPSRRSLAEAAYQHTLGRSPTAEEMQGAHELLGEPIQMEGLADLFFVLTMLPEFQLIY